MFASVPVLSKVPKSSEFTDVPLPRPEFNIIEEKNKAFDFVSETMATQEEQQIRHYMLYPEKYNMVWSVGNKTAIRLDNLVCDHYKKSIDEAYDTFIEGLINTPIGYYFSLKKDLLTSMNYHSTIASLKISKTQLSKFLTIVNQLPVYYQFKNKMIPGKVSIIEPLLGTNDNVDHEQHVKQLLSNHLSSDSDFKVVVNTNDSKIFSAEIEFDKNIYYVNTLKGGSFNNYSLIIEKIGDIDQNKYLYYQFIGNIGPTFKRTSGPGPDIISVTIKDQTYHVKLEDYGVFKGWSIGNVVYSNFSEYLLHLFNNKVKIFENKLKSSSLPQLTELNELKLFNKVYINLFDEIIQIKNYLENISVILNEKVPKLLSKKLDTVIPEPLKAIFNDIQSFMNNASTNINIYIYNRIEDSEHRFDKENTVIENRLQVAIENYLNTSINIDNTHYITDITTYFSSRTYV